MHVLAYCMQNKLDNTSKLLQYLQNKFCNVTFFFQSFDEFLQPPLVPVILLLMWKSQWGSDVGIF